MASDRTTRTVAELQGASEHLAYEVKMFEETCLALERGGLPHVQKCAFIESFTIHARVLLHFFFPQPPIHSTDVLADDFFPDRSWADRPVLPPALANVRDRVGKEIAHLTYNRLDIEAEAWQWNITAMREAIMPVVGQFARSVSRENLDVSKWSRFLVPEMPSFDFTGLPMAQPLNQPRGHTSVNTPTVNVNTPTVNPLVVAKTNSN